MTCGNDSRAKVWRFDGTTLTAEGHVIPIDGGGRVAFSPDGRLMAAVSWSARGNAVAIYDVPAFTLRQTLIGAVDFTIDVAFSPDDQHVIVLESNNVGDGRLLSFSLVSGNLATGPLGSIRWCSPFRRSPGPPAFRSRSLRSTETRASTPSEPAGSRRPRSST